MSTNGRESFSARGSRLLRDGVIWDNHSCLPLRADATFLPDVDRYRAAGVTVLSVNVGFAGMSWKEHLEILSFMRRWFAMRPDEYCLLSKVEDISRCKAEGRLGIVFDVEGMGPVQNDIGLVQTFYELGVRWMLVAYNHNNAAGGGCLDVDCGLTSTGRAIIDEMERVGMVLCLSHTGTQTALEALEYSRNPAIFSHSNPKGCNPHIRNITDDLMVACARKDGVIGLSGIGPFLGSGDDLTRLLLDQLRYVIDLVGCEHVGLGLDYVFDRSELAQYVSENPALFPAGMGDCQALPMIGPEALGTVAEGLARANLTDLQIYNVLGGNWLRIAERVWK